MSMPRPKRSSAARRADSSASSKDKGSSLAKPPKWKDAVGEEADEKFTPYAASKTFSNGALVLHPKFGKGLVLEVDGNKMSILFEDGIKKLMHGTPG